MDRDQTGAAVPSDRADAVSKPVPPSDAGRATLFPADADQAAAVQGGVEEEIWSGRTHWRHFAGRILLWTVGNLSAAILVGMIASRVDWLTWVGATWVVMVVVLISGAAILGRVTLHVLGTSFRLTTQRLFIERGILSRTIDQTELIRVDDVRMHQSFFDRMFDIGTISLLTTDASDRHLTIEGVRDPRRVAEAVRQRMRALRGKSVFVETL